MMLGQAVRLAQGARPTTQALSVGPIDRIAVAHDPLNGRLADDPLQDHTAAPSDQIEHGDGTDENPQPQRLVMRRPAGLVDMDQLGLLERLAPRLLDHRFQGARPVPGCTG